MRIDASKAIGAYAATITIALGFVLLTGLNSGKTAFGEIDVERINVREPDGTLRLTISNHARMPGIIIGDKEYPHPNRPEAGMIFFNNEGIENGGLVFDGALVNGRPTNSGSLTFDRYRQDQTVQVTSIEDGPTRSAGLYVNDRPNGPMDFSAIGKISAMAPGAGRDGAVRTANLTQIQRAFLGRGADKASSLELRDGAGHKRLVLSVSDEGLATIQFLDESGKVVRTVAADP
jgi:hypothetical protein